MPKEKKIVSLPAGFNVRSIEQQLQNFFLNETPAADAATVIPDSVKPVDVNFHLYKALVRTDVYMSSGEVKQHVSNIRYKVFDGRVAMLTFMESESPVKYSINTKTK